MFAFCHVKCAWSNKFYNTIFQIDDVDYARQLGLRDPPTLVHFSSGVPSIYYGEEKKEPVLAWLVHLKEEAVIEVVTEEILADLIEEEEYVMVFFRYFIKEVYV